VRPFFFMFMDELLTRFSSIPSIRALLERLGAGLSVTVRGVAGPAPALIAAQAARELSRPILLVADREIAARASLSDVRTLDKTIPCLAFAPDAPGFASNLNLLGPGVAGVVVTTVEQLNKPAPVIDDRETRNFAVSRGSSLAPGDLVAWLEENGYERTDLVTEPGEYAVRGGIIDCFADDGPLPVRVEFAGDRVLSLRTFDPLLQRSVKPLDTAALPGRRPPGHSDQPASSLLPPHFALIGEGVDVPSCGAAVFTGDDRADCDLGLEPAPVFLGNLDLLRQTMRESDHEYIIAASTNQQRERLHGLLGGRPRFLVAPLSSGLSCPAGRFTVLTERELYGSPVIRPVRHRFQGIPVDNVVALRPDDYVVHVDYGVGRFTGTRTITDSGVTKDCLVVQYAGTDRVYVPVENIGLLDRFVGGEDSTPPLDRLGSRAWLVAKARAARASAEYAQELLDNCARRAAARGTPFGPATEWLTELEASFPFAETQDQLRALADVGCDMARARPMDRLVCGDVGYGKTEIALRAALRAVASVKQVAVLAPTTILCYQHYATFRGRLARFPVRVEMLSRLAPSGQQSDVCAGLAAGAVDIVIGTHLLLGSRIHFRDLGLLVIDEEQKFGVRQKERIKALKAGVDVLTLTATPIPRTLYMGLAGLRDISCINTPPAGRREIATEVAAWDDQLIREYVGRELNRGGQVFFVHNEIASIQAVADRLGRLLPGLNLVVAHGQMSGRRLADIYLAFAAGEHQVLLSTAIIESGLDMPNVNTIIVNRADRFGLADLHQLRGRVGRSQEQAFALFLVPTQRAITPDARKRLSAILAYARLGSGFKLALRDMEIRGVGSLLGTEQHGHVARVGFNLYTQMLKEAVARLKGEPVAPEPELRLDDVPARIPDSYIADSFERVAIYKRLLSVETEPELSELEAELVDRFGRYPAEVEPLFRIALVRVRARKLGLLKVALRGRSITLVHPDRTEAMTGGIEDLLERLARPAQTNNLNTPPGRLDRECDSDGSRRQQ